MKNFFLLCFLIPFALFAQSGFPDEVHITTDGILQSGGQEVEGFYNIDAVNKLELTLQEPNWFELMDGPGGGGPGGGNAEGELLIGSLTYNDEIVLDSVMVGIKGQTSDFRNNSEKKSFKIEIDELKNQDLLGYDNLNLNCAFDDHSFMREVLYYDLSRDFAPALKANFVDLYINGEYWGPYNNVQQIEGGYIREWFGDNEGTRWRALNSENTGGGGPGGPGGGDPSRFGAGVSTLNYNGPDSSDYNMNYEIKKYSKDNPWEDLIAVCDALNNSPVEDLYEVLNPILDIDRTLWILAEEIVASDDDGYFFKGGMDYYVYWDHATGRLMPLEVDGNSVMQNSHVGWSPFYREEDDRFPLINRMLQNPEIRQRYLAHLRTVLSEFYVESRVHARIDEFANVLDQKVQDDPKKIYTYNQFLAGVTELKGFITTRINNLSQNIEINRQGIVANSVVRATSSGEETPVADEPVIVTAVVSGNVRKVMLYHATGIDGAFDRIEMTTDQNGNYTATIPGSLAGTYVRYYVEVIADDAFGTATYTPTGAEHQVYVYQVQAKRVVGDVVINEFMASNSMTVADGSGAFADWIELYNKGNETVDLTGYSLTDDAAELNKWMFPDNTVLEADEYLIIWADSDEEDTTADELHASFKLSAGGEAVILVNENNEVVDEIEYPEQQTDFSYARIPNGTGDFLFRTETFAGNNDGSTSDVDDEQAFSQVRIYPNPAQQVLHLDLAQSGITDLELLIHNALGELQLRKSMNSASVETLDISELAAGMYFLQLRAKNSNQQLVKKISVVD